MKILLAILLLLFPLPLAAGEPIQLALTTGVQAVVSSGAAAGGVTCDSCSGDLALAYHFEDTTDPYDCDQGDPCGCTDNASKALTLGGTATISTDTGTGWPTDGTHSLKLSTTVSTIPITWNKSAGTMSFDIYCPTFDVQARPIYIGSLGNDDIRLNLVRNGDNNRIYFQLRYNFGSEWTAYTDSNAFTGPKKNIVLKWDVDTAHSGNYMQLWVDGVEASHPVTTQPTAVNGTYTTVNFILDSGNVCYVDNFKLYTSWQ